MTAPEYTEAEAREHVAQVAQCADDERKASCELCERASELGLWPHQQKSENP